MTLWIHTLRALAQPRRAVPIGFVCAIMVYAQHWFAQDWVATLLGVAMASWFVLVAPFAWRYLSPPDARPRLSSLLIYLLLGGIPSALGWMLPRYQGIGTTFLTTGVNALVVASLFWVGGWGLARDIEQEGAVRRALARADAMARQAEQAQLLALRANLDPHFLFNTLNAIAEWTREDPAVAEAAILRLSDLLRQVMEGVRADAWPLARELELAHAVWDLYSIRDPDRFVVDWQVPDPIPAIELPPMILLPLIENAVKHGPAKGHDGILHLELVGKRLRISNPGSYAGPRPGGQGLDLIQRRLHLFYDPADTDGPPAKFEITSTQTPSGPRTTATLEL